VVTAPADELFAAVGALQPTVVFDALGGRFSSAAAEALAPFGRLVSFGVSSAPTTELNAGQQILPPRRGSRRLKTAR
jgi:NADPH:quinone reductase-like Zn-dependent oxidoreductase